MKKIFKELCKLDDDRDIINYCKNFNVKFITNYINYCWYKGYEDLEEKLLNLRKKKFNY
jgi:hypothetical protein